MPFLQERGEWAHALAPACGWESRGVGAAGRVSAAIVWPRVGACPRRYSYTFFAVMKNTNRLQDRVAELQGETAQLKQKVTFLTGERDGLQHSLLGLREFSNQWKAWATASRSVLLSMPGAEPQPPPRASERSRSPVTRAPLGEYNG